MSNDSPGPFGGGPVTWDQGRSFERNDWPPRDVMPFPDKALWTPISSAILFLRADTPRDQPIGLDPTQSLGVSIFVQASDPDSHVALSSARAASVERVIGPLPAGPTKPTATEVITIIVAPGGALQAATPSPTETGGDHMGGPQPAASSGSARLVPVGLNLAASTAAFAPSWATPADPVRQEPGRATPPVAALGDIEAFRESVGRSPDELPAPRGADLITHLEASLRSAREDRLPWLLDRFGGLGEPLQQQAHNSHYLSPVALAVAALEIARRWRRRSTAEARSSRRSRDFGMNGFL